jgi:hypothetical protein
MLTGPIPPVNCLELFLARVLSSTDIMHDGDEIEGISEPVRGHSAFALIFAKRLQARSWALPRQGQAVRTADVAVTAWSLSLIHKVTLVVCRFADQLRAPFSI